MTEDHTETDGESTDDTAASPPTGSESSDPTTDTNATDTTDTNAADTDDPENDTTDDSSTADDEPYSTNGDGDDNESQTGDDDGFQTGDDKEDELRTGDNDGLQTDVPINIPQTDQSTDSSRDRSTAAADLDMDNVLDADDEDSEGLFDDLLSGEPIFEKKEVLRPSYTPGELPHRNDQINQMATVLVSALRGDTPSNILIYGKTGTGKTASAKYVSNELESTSQKYDVPCEVEYINCEVTDTQYRVLAQLANKFIEKNQALIESRIEALETVRDELAGETDSTDGPADTPSDTSTADSTDHIELTDAIDSAEADGSHVTTGDETVVSIPDAESDGEDAPEGTLPIANEAYDSVEAVEERIESLRADAEKMETVPMTGWPTDRVYNSFFDAVDYNERVVVIMLDEIDKLVEKSGDDTLYNLSRMNNELENSRISIMGISNDLKFTDFLDPRVKSSLGEEEIVFPPYDATQLGDILQHRAETAFKPDSLTDDVIPLCSAFAAQEHGDARRALDLLRTAGELAERGQADDVEEEHVRKAQDKIELDRVVEVVRTLPTQSKIVLYSIILLEQNGVENINTGEVFNIYRTSVRRSTPTCSRSDA
ncbi:MAG: orc1/cdc6 family replication initiation protein [Halonotius sp. J07HN6]|nr:MAG: orc1/cdc6 family replication initiation protein [Halonotius sp. J07HN6]